MSGMMTRNELTTHADKLGIPWTNDSSDAEIAALIAARENGNVSTPAPSKNPECFGLMWDAATEQTCKGCPGQNSCLETLVTTTLPKALKTLPSNPPLGVIAASLSVSEEAAGVIMEKYQGKSGTSAKVVPIKPPAAPPPPVAEAPAPAPVAIQPPPAAPIQQPTLVPPAQEAPPVPVQATKSKAELKAEKDAAKQAEKEAKDMAKQKAKEEKDAAKQAAKEAKDAEKAKAKADAEAEKAAEAPANPTRATLPASPAVEVASPAEAKSADRARVRADRRVATPWGPQTYGSRFQKERSRSPLLAALKPGNKLKETYKGQEVEVVVKSDHYQYDGKQWPTLYSVVKEVTGTVERQKQLVEGKRPPGSRQLCNWSAVRFFRASLINIGLLSGKLRQPKAEKSAPAARVKPSKAPSKPRTPKAKPEAKVKPVVQAKPKEAKPKASKPSGKKSRAAKQKKSAKPKAQQRKPQAKAQRKPAPKAKPKAKAKAKK